MNYIKPYPNRQTGREQAGNLAGAELEFVSIPGVLNGNERTMQILDWDAIAEVKQTVAIAVIGNGDVRRDDLDHLQDNVLAAPVRRRQDNKQRALEGVDRVGAA